MTDHYLLKPARDPRLSVRTSNFFCKHNFKQLLRKMLTADRSTTELRWNRDLQLGAGTLPIDQSRQASFDKMRIWLREAPGPAFCVSAEPRPTGFITLHLFLCREHELAPNLLKFTQLFLGNNRSTCAC